jgi:hypothetical protein
VCERDDQYSQSAAECPFRAILKDTDSDKAPESDQPPKLLQYLFHCACSRPTKSTSADTAWMELERDPTIARTDFHAVSRLAIERTTKGWSPDLRKGARGPSSSP